MQRQNAFYATVNKVQTLADQGLRITLDLPEQAIYTAAWLMECKRAGRVLIFKAAIDDPETGSQAERG